LDTVVADPYYVDRSGKRWSVVSLGGMTDFSSSPGELAAGLVLDLRDGASTRSLAASVRVCADLGFTLVICK
jgi:hypothetical protein